MDRFRDRTDRDSLLLNALHHAVRASDAADMAGAESLPGEDFELYVGQASAYADASQAYSALLAVTRDSDFREG